MATTAVPYLLEDLMLVQAFMVSLHVPKLERGEDVKTVLKELVPMAQVSKDMGGGDGGGVEENVQAHRHLMMMKSNCYYSDGSRFLIKVTLFDCA